MTASIFEYFKVFNLIEASTDNLQHETDPAETNQTEKSFEKSEFIIDDINSLIDPLTSIVSNSYISGIERLLTDRSISVLTPPPNSI